MHFPIVLIAVLVILVNCEGTCTPPQELTNSESSCLESSTSFFQRVQHQATGLFATAKRKLGIDPNAQDEPLNCDYYLCILRSIGLVNAYGILELEGIKQWLNKNVPQEYNNEMMQHATSCFEKIGINTANETNCDRSPDYVKCLHNFEKCQIFKYP